jgi:hypothetical protein
LASTKTLQTRIKHKYDTSTNWDNSTNPLLQGELGISNDDGVIKVGDGTNTYNKLEDTHVYPSKYYLDNSPAVPLIIGTQTKATGTWTGVSDTIVALKDGLTIKYWLPYAGSGSASLTLTLKDGTTTGAIPVYYGGTTRINAQYEAGCILTLTYLSEPNVKGDIKSAGWWADANSDTDTNIYDKTKYAGVIYAKKAISASNIITGNSEGYSQLNSGDAFDITYPILYATKSITINKTGSENYILTSFTTSTTQKGNFTLYKTIFIKGTLSGTTFTPISTTPLVQIDDTTDTDESYYYVLLGLVSKATEMYLAPPHPVYKFIDGVFSLVNTWRPVVDNLTSTDTDKSLSANQGKVLDDKKLNHTTITTATDLDTLTTTGIYHLKVSNNTKVPTTGNGTLYVDFNVSTPYQIWEADSVTGKYYKRTYTNSSWGSWVTLYRTDTVTTATTSGSGNVLTSITATNGALSITKDLSVYSKSETYTQTEINNLLLNYVPKTGGEFTGAVTISDELYNDSATLGDVIVSGSARFNNTVYISQTPSTDTQAANKKYVDDAIKAGFAANDAMVFKGVVDSTTTWNKINSATHSAGDTYRVSVKGTYGNDVCEVGDLIICINDGTSANNDDWIVVQTNIDGAVINSSKSGTEGNVVVFKNATDIKDSGIASSDIQKKSDMKGLTIQTMNGSTASNVCTYKPKDNDEIFILKGGTNVSLSADNSNHTHTITINSPDTHLTSKNIVGNSEATTNTTSVLTNGNVYLKHIESNSTTATSSHLIKGTGSATVETDSSGNIIVDSVPLIIGTQTTTTASWTGKAETISVLKDGMSIKYWLPTTSASNVTLNLTLKGGSTTGALPVYYSGTTRLTTHYAANNIVSLVYRENVTIGSTTIAKGFWCDGDYNSNTDVYVKQTLTSNNDSYPLLASTKNTGTTTTDVTTTAYRNNNIYMRPSTGALTVSKLFSSFNSNGEDDSTHCVDLQGEYSTPNYSSINTKFYMNDNGFYLGVNSNGMENAICTSNSKLTIRTNDCYIYSSTNFKLNTVESIKIDAGTDFKIYENGYRRFQIADQTYLCNKDNSVALQMSDSTMSLYGDTIEAYSNYGGIKFDLSNSGDYGDYGKFTVRNANSIGLYVPNEAVNKTFKLYVGRNNAKIGFINTLENNNSYGGKIDNGIAIGKSKTRIYGMLQHQGDRRVFSTNGQDNTRSEGTSAKAGWIKLATISLDNNFGCQHNGYLYFKIINKAQSNNEPTELFICVQGNSDSSSDYYSLDKRSFEYSGVTYSQNTNYVFLVKSSDLCYDLYVKKITSEDFVTVLDFHNQAALHNINVEWHKNSLVTTMPSNPIYPTLITKTNNLNAESITSKNVTISNNLTVGNSITANRIIADPNKSNNLNIDYTGLKLRKADATTILQFENTKAYPVQNSGTLVSFDLGASGYEFNNIYAMLFIAKQQFTLTNGKVSGLAAGTSRLYGNGLVISNPKISNDLGWIRVTGTAETDTVLEIATGDDGGAGEQIVARQYNTSSAIVNELKLLDNSGNTKVPHKLEIGEYLHRPGKSSSWYNGRDNAMIIQTSIATSGYSPILSTKTSAGSWELGPLYSDSGMYLNYITDTNYSAKTNTQTAYYKFGTDGVLTTNKIKTQYIEGSEGLTIKTMNDGKIWFRNSTDENNYAVIQKNSDGKFEFRLSTIGATDNSDFHLLGNTIYWNSLPTTTNNTTTYTTYGSINSDTFNVNSKKSIFRNIVPFATENYSLGQDNDDGKLYWNKLYVKDITATGDVSIDGTLTTCNIYPKADNSYNLGGSSTLRWKNVYAVTFNGALSGNATTATQLATARTITLAGDLTGSVSFSGASNVTLNGYAYYSTITVGNTNNYPYHRIAKLDTITTTYTDKCITLYISQGYNTGNYGIARVVLRTNSGTAVSTVNIEWLVRKGFAVDALQAGIYNVCGSTYCDLFLKTQSAYAGAVIRDIGSEARNSIGRTWTLVNSTEVNNTTSSDALTSTECYASLAIAATKLHSQAYSLTKDEDIPKGVDVGEVNKANSATTADSATYASQGKDDTFTTKTLLGKKNLTIGADSLYIRPYDTTQNPYASFTSSMFTVNIDNTTIRNVKPYADSKYNLGDSNLCWNYIYGKELRISSVDNTTADNSNSISLNSKVSFNGGHLYCFADSTYSDIDMYSDYSFEIGRRRGANLSDSWYNCINFSYGNINLISDNNINLKADYSIHINCDNTTKITADIIKLSSDSSTYLRSGQFALLVDGNIIFSNKSRNTQSGILHYGLYDMYETGVFGKDISSSIGKFYSDSDAQQDNVCMISNAKLVTVSRSQTDILAGSGLNLYSGGYINLFSDTGARVLSDYNIELIPGSTHDTDYYPSPNYYVRTGNIKGRDLTNDTKPTITNFSDIHSEKFEVDGKWNISVNSETGALDFCIK